MHILIIFCLLFTTFFAEAKDVSIDTFKITFHENKKEKKYTTIKNNNLIDKSFIEVVLEEVTLSDSQNLIYKEVKNNKNGLIVTPNKLILQNSQKENSKQKISFINLHKNLNKEKIYRATYFPRISEEEKKHKDSFLKVRVFVAYETYIYIEPNVINFSYDYTIDKNKFTLKNNGNISFLLVNGKECIEGVCTSLSNKNIISGREKTFNIKEGAEIYYQMKYGKNGIKEVIFK